MCMTTIAGVSNGASCHPGFGRYYLNASQHPSIGNGKERESPPPCVYVRVGHPKETEEPSFRRLVSLCEFSFGSNLPTTRSRKRSMIDCRCGGDGQVSPQAEMCLPTQGK